MDAKYISFNIAPPEHFSFSECFAFLKRGYDECLYSLVGNSIRRAIRIKDKLVLIDVSEQDSQLNVRFYQDNLTPSEIKLIQSYVEDWFDLNRDISDFYSQLKQRPETKAFVKKYNGLRLMGIVDLFEVLSWCVIGQQINLTFAHQIKTRLVHQFGEFIEFENQRYYLFPTPESIIACEDSVLAEMKFSRQKIQYIKNVAAAMMDNQISKSQLIQQKPQEQIKQLTQIKGIGPWTANYVSMKCLRNMNCIAYGDTGLSSALHEYFETEKKPSYEKIDSIFAKYKGWESYLNFYLWHSLAN